MNILRSCLVVLALFCLPCGYAQNRADALIDSLETVLRTSPAEGRALFYQYLDLVGLYSLYDFSISMEYAREGREEALKQDDIYWVAEFDYKIGETFFFKGQLDSAMFYYASSDSLRREAVRMGKEDKENNDYLDMFLLARKSEVDTAYGNFDSAIENYFGALAIAERIDDAEEVINLYDGIASVYLKMSNLERAEEYYRKMEQLSHIEGDSIGVATAYLGLSSIRSSRDEQQEALRYAEAGYRILTSYDGIINPSYLMEASLRMAEAWIGIADYNRALEYALQTVDYAEQSGFPNHLTSALYTLAVLYLKLGDYERSERLSFEALAADSTNMYSLTLIYANIVQANIRMGRSEKADEYLGKTLDAHRAYSNQNFQSALSEMEVKYETEKKEARITVLEEEKKLVTWLGISAGTVLLLASVAFFFLWLWTVQKKRVVATRALLDGETTERARLARDLHDGLGSMLTGIKLSLENMQNDGISGVAPSLDMMKESINELRRISHHLIPNALEEEGLKSALAAFCRSLPDVRFGWFGGEERVGPQMEVAIYRIVHELVNNALKHSGASEILVQVMRETDYIAFTVRDNGCGFDSSAVSQGMGLRNIRDRVVSSGGRLLVDSRPGEGTEINVNFTIK